MDENLIFDLVRQALWIAVRMSAPLLAVALIAGVVIGLFQALTSVQEMTLTFIPKIVCMFLALLVALPWLMERMITFTRDVFINIPNYVR